MEKLKIQISEVEGVSIKIPTEFTAQSYTKFYNQMLAINKSMPVKAFVPKYDKAITEVSEYKPVKIPNTTSRLNLTFWGDKKDQLLMLDIYEKKGKEMLIDWMEKTRSIELNKDEKANLSRFVAVIRAKYKMRSAREW